MRLLGFDWALWVGGELRWLRGCFDGENKMILDVVFVYVLPCVTLRADGNFIVRYILSDISYICPIRVCREAKQVLWISFDRNYLGT